MKSECHICGETTVKLVPGFENLPTISSDARILETGFYLGQCEYCRNTVKIIDDHWRRVTARLYEEYLSADGATDGDRPLFDASGKAQKTRTDRLAECLFESFSPSQNAGVLDVGTGVGTFLKAINKIRPDLALSANDLAGTHKKRIEQISGVQMFYEGDVLQIDNQFELISMLHVIEHIPDPVRFLRLLRSKISPDGALLLVAPETSANPFDLLVADHCSHFTTDALCNLVKAAGYEVIASSGEWVPRELAVLAKPLGDEAGNNRKIEPFCDLINLSAQLNFLEELRRKSMARSSRTPVGVFGASLGGAWLAACLGDRVGFFVDESPARLGQSFLGRKILAPDQVPQGSMVFIGLPTKTAQLIESRLCTYNFEILYA